MQIIKSTWTGIRPLVMHNGLMADPTNPATREIKRIVGKGSKKLTDADHESRNRLEWEAGLYWDDKDGLVIPSDNIERCIQLGAQKSRKGKDVQAAVFCTTPNVPIRHSGPKTKDEMYAYGLKNPSTYILRKGVSVQKNRVIRIRPMVPTGWSVEVEIEFDETIIDPESIIRAITDAGSLVGLGDWRPKFGRFIASF